MKRLSGLAVEANQRIKQRERQEGVR
jgi:hypothetical protein